jgi:hypothetical protein
MKAFPSVAAILPGFLLAALCQAGAPVQAAKRVPTVPYYRMVEKVAALPGDERAQSLAVRRGLQVLNVLWEETGRWLGSSIGPNISDVTIEVQAKDGRGQTRTALMPVIRNPNFEDKTGDVAIDKLKITKLGPAAVLQRRWRAGAADRRAIVDREGRWRD